MRKIDIVCRELLRQGKLDFGQCATILGAIDTIEDMRAIGGTQWAEFTISYGLQTVDGLSELLAEQPEK